MSFVTFMALQGIVHAQLLNVVGKENLSQPTCISVAHSVTGYINFTVVETSYRFGIL